MQKNVASGLDKTIRNNFQKVMKQIEMTDKIRQILIDKNCQLEEKKMFGGICFMVNEKMCVAVKPEKIMLRIDPKYYETIAESEDFQAMVHSGKTMPGFVFVDIEGLSSKKLQYWIDLALEYNKIAPTSKKKK